MNKDSSQSESQLDSLFAAMRERRPDTAKAEYAFETRLMAQLRAKRESESNWVTVSWRMMPFFAACVVVLALCQVEMVSSSSDSLQMACAENPEAVDLLETLN